MQRSRYFILFPTLLAVLVLGLGQTSGQLAVASAKALAAAKMASQPTPTQMMANRITPAMRKAAAERLAAQRLLKVASPLGQMGISGLTAAAAAPGVMDPLGQPDYMGGIIPNYANSPLPSLDSLGNVIPGTGIRKFVDSLPGLGAANANDLGQYIPVAVPDTTTYPGSDYYEIGLVQYTEQLHKDLPATTLRGYVQLNTTDPAVGKPSYLGPTIIAQRDRPVRVKFTNMLPTGSGGNLFLPVDTTMMGAGLGPLGVAGGNYTQNRATLHLHGGATPWISDGTPHQWTTPAGENTPYPKGVSVQDVPDMAPAGPGSLTFYYTNQQSARLMFYHDHAYGITRLNVYAGEAAPYVLSDPVEQALVNGGTVGTMTVAAGTIPATQVPLVIQDKTFVPQISQLATQDPTWDMAHWGGFGNLWFPHVYMPNQNPADISGANAMGRWDYGPWFWPPSVPTNGPTAAGDPGTPNPSLVPEAFMDTPLVNGTAYPFLKVERKAYRFRILNASNDRTLNLQLYFAKSNTPDSVDANGMPTLQTASGEVPMVPAVPHSGVATWPSTWPTDGRDGGVPDPTAAGPKMIQIGTEGGLLPAPVVLDNMPIGYNYNRRDIVVLNVSNKTLMLGPAERADVVVDFSQVPDGSKLILYNDAPAPVPAFDPRYDYYTGDPDQTPMGGAPTTLAGYGPNTRTIMQFQVGSPTAAAPFNLAAIQAALPAAFKASQDPIIVPQKAYGGTTDTYSRIQSTTLDFTPEGTTTPLSITMQRKAIQELFETDYGRMNATLGVELPFTNILTQTTIPLGYIDPATENLTDNVTAMSPVAGDGTQIWKITHNGVDTHAIHFHLFNVQLINRVGWDGAIRPPDPNELGWKETIRMNPLEDAIVALRPVAPKLPFDVPDSVRPLDPTRPLGSTMGFLGVDPTTGNPMTVTNVMTNFGWEYVWHCHLLGHEENDMMRPMVFQVESVVPSAPVLSASRSATGVALAWIDPTPMPANLGNHANEIGFRIERAVIGSNNLPGAYSVIGYALANATTYADTTTNPNVAYAYRVVAYNQAGGTASNVVLVWVTVPAAPTNLTATLQTGPQVAVAWSDNATNEAGFVLERSVNGGAFTQLAAIGANAGTGPMNYTDTTVTAGNTYAYRVLAQNANGPSAYSNTATVTVPSLPAAPTNLTAVQIAGPQVAVAWSDNATNEAGFVLERSVNGGAFTQLAAIGANAGTGPMAYTDSAVAAGNTYIYQVKAVNLGGSSPYSNTATVTIIGPPPAPTGLMAVLQAGPRVLLNWTDNALNESSYVIERSTNGGAFATLATLGPNTGTGVMSYPDTTVAVGNTYAYRVKAVNVSGSSPYSNTATAYVRLPAAPSGLTATTSRLTATTDRVFLRWVDNANNEGGFTVQRGSTATFAVILGTSNRPINATTFTQTGLPRRATYYYRVRAFNVLGVSAWSNVVRVVTP